jgi:uncharacterized protein (TIGR02145 family)
MNKQLSILLFICFGLLSVCDSSTEPKTIHGCLDSQACNYNPSATIDNNSCEYLDNCDVCDNDPTNDCGQDCNDEWGGTATVDDCGVCSGSSTGHESNSDDVGCGCFNPAQQTYCYDADNDLLGSIGSEIDYCLQDLPEGWVLDCTDEDDACMSNSYDCYDICDGLAFIDDCGECSGGNTGYEPNSDMDCAGICSGTSIVDDCGVCDGYDLAKDCWGDCFGNAFDDQCGVCSSGNTGHEPNSDMDCADVCFGISYIDECGICDDDSNTDCIQDCYGEWDGEAFLDECNICSNGSSGHIANSDQDCAGTCFGDDISCIECIDIDGNGYNIVLIGDQIWMAENLEVTHYNNGDEIPTGYSSSGWSNISIGAYAVYNGNPINANIYGNLYNWYSVNDEREICPEGWDVPTDNKWTELTDFLGDNAGGKMKATGTIEGDDGLWYAPNTGATNESGFNGLPAGYRYGHSGNYTSIGNYGYFWSASASSPGNAWYQTQHYDNSIVGRNDMNKPCGLTIRCVRD